MAVQSVKAVINGQTVNLSYNSVSGKWEGTATAPAVTSYSQPGHVYGVTITAEDSAGNQTVKDQTDTTLGDSLKLAVKETTAPVITVSSPSSGARVTSNKPPISFSLRDETNGSGIAIASLVLKIDGGAAISNTAAGMACNSVTGGYDCTYTPQTALSDGAHTFTVDISDNDGNAAAEASSSFTSDTVAPSLNVSTPANGSVTNNTSCTVSGTTNDSTSSPVTIVIKLNGVDQGTVSVSSGSFSKAITLAQGSNTIVVTATDAAGLQTTVTRMITLDTTPPVISAVTITPQDTTTGTGYTISVTVSDV